MAEYGPQTRFDWQMGNLSNVRLGNVPDGPTYAESKAEREATRVRQAEMQRRMLNPLGKESTARGFSKIGFGLGMGIDTYMNLKAGDNLGTAAVKGAVTGMLWTTMPGLMTAHMLATSMPGVVSAVNNWTRQKEVWWNQAHRGNFGGNYQDTQRALTMRQAAVEAIQGSKLNARSALGGEARILSQQMFRG